MMIGGGEKLYQTALALVPEAIGLPFPVSAIKEERAFSIWEYKL